MAAFGAVSTRAANVESVTSNGAAAGPHPSSTWTTIRGRRAGPSCSVRCSAADRHRPSSTSMSGWPPAPGGSAAELARACRPVAHLAAVARVLPETPCLRRPTTNPPIWWDIYPKSGLSDKSQVRAGGFHRFRW